MYNNLGALMDEEIIGLSPAFQQVLALVRMIAKSDSVTLIQGETGTGKEVIASAIHNQSSRKPGPICKVELRRDPGALAGERTLRPRTRRLHGSMHANQGAIPTGRPGHALSGRDRRFAAGAATQTPARPAGAGVRAAGQQPDDPGERAGGSCHQSGSRSVGGE